MLIIMLAGIAFLLFTFIMGRSAQKKQAQRETELMQKLKTGEWVLTQSGFYGKFVELDGEVVILENEDGVESYWSKAAIAMLKPPPFAQTVEDNTEYLNADNQEEAEIQEQEQLEEKLVNSDSSLEWEEDK